jgi:outer membrane receptor protein involved in Fe transport
VHDVSLARDFSRFKLNLGVENVFDRYYETECGFPAAGINFFVSLSAGI